MVKIFRGYMVAGNPIHTDLMFETVQEYKSLENFLQNETNFSSWVKENKEDLLFQKGNKAGEISIKKINKKEWQGLFDKYNEGDELLSYYSFVDLDNTKDFSKKYNTEDIEEVKEIHRRYTKLLEKQESYSNYPKDSYESSKYEEVSKEVEEFEKKYNIL